MKWFALWMAPLFCPLLTAQAELPSLVPSIALIQYNADAHFGDYDYNRARLREFADKAVSEGARIIVFPEGAHWGYASADRAWCKKEVSDCSGRVCIDARTIAEEMPGGKTSQYWEAFAKKHQVHVLFNMPEKLATRGPAEIYYNTTAVVGPSGLVAKYRKRALYAIDSCYAAAGNSETVFTTEYGKFGLLTCMDVNYLNLITSYHSKKVNAVILVTDWDQSPIFQPVRRPAREFFAQQAARAKMDIYASDVSPWDGTGKYFAKGGPRERRGLPDIAINQDGVSFHELK